MAASNSLLDLGGRETVLQAEYRLHRQADRKFNLRRRAEHTEYLAFVALNEGHRTRAKWLYFLSTVLERRSR